MPSVFERLRDALAPEYELERELGGGGMGIVFLAREVALDRRVAIKTIRPELATARATERFLREARALAQLKHPNIMPVHRAGEAEGFAYYVMDYCEDETLEERLRRGPVRSAEAVRLGCELLEGLEAVHRAGLVHRDIKPSNVFIVGNRAVLGDFGLAVPQDVGASTPTDPIGFVGTPGYTPPEQAAGGTVTGRTDLYAVGVVVYEAVTGQRWYSPAPERAPDWSRVPAALRGVLRRALAWSPERRWPDAGSFRRALSSRARGLTGRPVALAGLAVVVALLVWRWWPAPSPVESSMHLVLVRAFDPGGVPGRPMLGDSLAGLVASGLAGIPEIVVLPPADSSGPAGLELGGVLRASGATLCARAFLRPVKRPAMPLPETCAPAEPVLALADSLSRQILLTLWTADQPLIADLPRNAIPSTPRGVDAWARAEQLFAQGRWGEAYRAYLDAERTDTTCWLCAWRLYFVENWMSLPHDAERFQRFLTHIDQFPALYRSIMGASALPMTQRLDTLRRTAQRYPQSFFAWWFYGNEQLNRGPLTGHWRREALESFIRAAELSPAFAPGWEDLAWIGTAEGDSSVAHHAMDQWARAMGGAPRDTFSMALRDLLTLGYAWRFSPGPRAQEVTRRVLLRPEILASAYLPAGPRLMHTMDAPAGAVWFGGRLAKMRGRPDLARSGLLAQVFGYTALGRPDSARARLEELRGRFPEPEVELFEAEFLATLTQVDSEGVPMWRPAALRQLTRLAAPGALAPEARAQASGMLALLTGTQPGSPPPPELRRLLAAMVLAQQQRWADAIARTDSVELDPGAHVPSPVIRALVKLNRADWFVHQGSIEAARWELRWSEHFQMEGLPGGPPQTADVDWSLRTLARWRLATILDQAHVTDEEVCLAYIRAASAWAQGSRVFRARADSARRRAAQLSCPPGM